MIRHCLGRVGLAVVALVVAAGCTHYASDAGSGDGRLRVAGPAGAIAVNVGGKGGVPVMFVHSYAGSKAHWTAQLADDIAAVVDKLGLKRLVLVVVTDDDDQPYAWHCLLPRLPSRTIAGTSHWPHLDKPDELNRVLDTFLASVQ